MKTINFFKEQAFHFLSGAVLFVIIAVSLFLYKPLLNHIYAAQVQLRIAQEKIALIRTQIGKGGNTHVNGRLLEESEAHIAIDEISNSAAVHNVQLISLRPQTVDSLGESSYGRLPIDIDMQTGYKDLGMFLEELENLGQSIVTIRSFKLSHEGVAPPLLRAQILLDIYLRVNK